MNLLILPNWNLHGVEDHISLNHERPSTQSIWLKDEYNPLFLKTFECLQFLVGNDLLNGMKEQDC